MKTIQFFRDEIRKMREEMQDAKNELSKPKLDEKYAKSQRSIVKRNKKE